MKQTKDSVRRLISDQKKKLSANSISTLSDEVLMVLEATDTFCKAENILMYSSLKSEVQLQPLFEKYSGQKCFYLPVVEKGTNLLSVREYKKDTQFEISDMGILEPVGSDISSLQILDLVLVPGIAFDYQLNRLGRGKGYYDRFLKQIKASKIGLCFEFQLLENIPADENDVKMDMIVSENEIISGGIY